MERFGNYPDPIPEHLRKTADELLSTAVRHYGGNTRGYRLYVNEFGQPTSLAGARVAGCCGLFVLCGFLYEKAAPTQVGKLNLELMRWCLKQAINAAIDYSGQNGTRYIVALTGAQEKMWGPALADMGFVQHQGEWTNRRTNRTLHTYHLDR